MLYLLLAGEPRAFLKRFELRPRDLRVHPPAKAAISLGDHVLTADRIRVGEDTIGNELWVLDGRLSHG